LGFKHTKVNAFAASHDHERYNTEMASLRQSNRSNRSYYNCVIRYIPVNEIIVREYWVIGELNNFKILVSVPAGI